MCTLLKSYALRCLQDQAEAAGDLFGYPFMLKTKRDAYDGKGNALVKDADSLSAAAASLGGYEKGLYAEKLMPFVKELAVMVARCSTKHTNVSA